MKKNNKNNLNIEKEINKKQTKNSLFNFNDYIYLILILN